LFILETSIREYSRNCRLIAESNALASFLPSIYAKQHMYSLTETHLNVRHTECKWLWTVPQFLPSPSFLGCVKTQPIYSFGIGVPKWPLFLWWFPISLYYKYALYCKCWEPQILTSGMLTSDRGFPGNTLFHIFSLGLSLGINLFYLT